MRYSTSLNSHWIGLHQPSKLNVQEFRYGTFLYSYWIGLHVHFKKAILHLKRAVVRFSLSICARSQTKTLLCNLIFCRIIFITGTLQYSNFVHYVTNSQWNTHNDGVHSTAVWVGGKSWDRCIVEKTTFWKEKKVDWTCLVPANTCLTVR